MEPSLVDRGLISLHIFDGVKPNTYEPAEGSSTQLTGPRGIGKTSLMTHILDQEMLPERAYPKVRKARAEADDLRINKGYSKAVIPADVNHLVYCDIPIKTCRDQGYKPRTAHKLDVNRMLLPRQGNNAQFFPCGAIFGIDELMNKFAARNFNQKDGRMPKEMGEFLAIIRHRRIAIITTCLVADGANKGFRDMTQNVLYIAHRVDQKRGDQLTQTTWYCLEFFSTDACDKFIKDGKRDIPFTPYVFVHRGDIRKCVDSYCENDKFIQGMENQPIEFPKWGAV